MTKQEALESLKFEVYEEGHCSYIEEELSIAIEALEKQIAKKPIIINFYDKTDDSYVRVSRCSRCEEYVYRGEIYCSKCGQKLDWSETDD
jgi:hypothetical protein